MPGDRPLAVDRRRPRSSRGPRSRRLSPSGAGLPTSDGSEDGEHDAVRVGDQHVVSAGEASARSTDGASACRVRRRQCCRRSVSWSRTTPRLATYSATERICAPRSSSKPCVDCRTEMTPTTPSTSDDDRELEDEELPGQRQLRRRRAATGDGENAATTTTTTSFASAMVTHATGARHARTDHRCRTAEEVSWCR